MIGIYLLVTIFTQLSPIVHLPDSYSLAFLPTTTSFSTEAIEVSIFFDELNGLKIGTPVLVDGRQVGTVAQIIHPEGDHASNYEVALSISASACRELRTDSIALQASPMSVSRPAPERVIELVSLPGSGGKSLQGGETIAGFSSLEKFWSAGSKA